MRFYLGVCAWFATSCGVSISLVFTAVGAFLFRVPIVAALFVLVRTTIQVRLEAECYSGSGYFVGMQLTLRSWSTIQMLAVKLDQWYALTLFASGMEKALRRLQALFMMPGLMQRFKV